MPQNKYGGIWVAITGQRKKAIDIGNVITESIDVYPARLFTIGTPAMSSKVTGIDCMTGQGEVFADMRVSTAVLAQAVDQNDD